MCSVIKDTLTTVFNSIVFGSGHWLWTLQTLHLSKEIWYVSPANNLWTSNSFTFFGSCDAKSTCLTFSNIDGFLVIHPSRQNQPHFWLADSIVFIKQTGRKITILCVWSLLSLLYNSLCETFVFQCSLKYFDKKWSYSPFFPGHHAHIINSRWKCYRTPK